MALVRDWALSVLTQCVVRLDTKVAHHVELLMSAVRALTTTMYEQRGTAVVYRPDGWAFGFASLVTRTKGEPTWGARAARQKQSTRRPHDND